MAGGSIGPYALGLGMMRIPRPPKQGPPGMACSLSCLKGPNGLL